MNNYVVLLVLSGWLLRVHAAQNFHQQLAESHDQELAQIRLHIELAHNPMLPRTAEEKCYQNEKIQLAGLRTIHDQLYAESYWGNEFMSFAQRTQLSTQFLSEKCTRATLLRKVGEFVGAQRSKWQGEGFEDLAARVGLVLMRSSCVVAKKQSAGHGNFKGNPAVVYCK